MSTLFYKNPRFLSLIFHIQVYLVLQSVNTKTFHIMKHAIYTVHDLA